MSDLPIVPDITDEDPSNAPYHTGCGDDDIHVVPNSNATFIPSAEELSNVTVPDTDGDSSSRKLKFRLKLKNRYTLKAWLQMHHIILSPLEVNGQSSAPPVRRPVMTSSSSASPPTTT
jgi:hypothetical protein